MEKYLEVYGLKTLFATQSVIYFNNNRYTYKTSFQVEGRAGLEKELNKALTSSKKYKLNSWTKVLLEALLSSDWFLDGNFIKSDEK